MCMKDFLEFLNEYKVVGLAVAFIMGVATNNLVKSLVDNMVMPLVNPLLPGGGWETYTLVLGPFQLGVGPFLASLLNFLIIALVVFVIIKKVPKVGKTAKK
jgi:large conductance mechanosensitive channel